MHREVIQAAGGRDWRGNGGIIKSVNKITILPWEMKPLLSRLKMKEQHLFAPPHPSVPRLLSGHCAHLLDLIRRLGADKGACDEEQHLGPSSGLHNNQVLHLDMCAWGGGAAERR